MNNESPTEHVYNSQDRQDEGDARHQATEDRADVSDTRQDVNDVRQDVSDTRQDDNDTRQDVSDTRQDVNDTRQDVSDVRQDDSDTRQDIGEAATARNTVKIGQSQNQQDVTNMITNAHTEQIQGMQAEAIQHKEAREEQEQHLDRITEGVDFLAIQVTTLNERVYTKNYLDKARNYLIAFSLIIFLFVSGVLGLGLVNIKEEGKKSELQNIKRTNEATQTRRQLADCELPPGRILGDGYVNPGVCFKEQQARIKMSIDEATAVVREMLIIQADISASNSQLSEEIRATSAAQVKALRAPPTTVTPSSSMQITTTTTTQPIDPTLKTQESGLVCKVLSILGLCDA